MYFNMIDKDINKVIMPIVIEPKVKKAKIDKFMEIKVDILAQLPKVYRFILKNPFTHTRALVILNQDD